MPNRILREGILTSERVNALGSTEEVFYRRLMSVVDDFGRYFAHPSLLRAALFALKLDKVSDSDIGKWLLATEKAGLVRVYPAPDGKRYLEMLDFRQQARAKESKFPRPPTDAPHLHSTCTAPATHAHDKGVASAPVFGDGDVSEGGDEKKPRVAAQSPPCPQDVDEKVWQDFLAIRKAKRSPLTTTALLGIEREAAKAGVTLAQAVAACCELGWQSFNAGWYAERQSKPSAAGRRASTLAGLTGQPIGGTHGRDHSVVEVVATVVG